MITFLGFQEKREKVSVNSERLNEPCYSAMCNSMGKGGGGGGVGVGVLTAKFLEAKYEHKVEFRGGRGAGCKTKIFHGGCRDIFCNYKM